MVTVKKRVEITNSVRYRQRIADCQKYAATAQDHRCQCDYQFTPPIANGCDSVLTSCKAFTLTGQRHCNTQYTGQMTAETDNSTESGIDTECCLKTALPCMFLPFRLCVPVTLPTTYQENVTTLLPTAT